MKHRQKAIVSILLVFLLSVSFNSFLQATDVLQDVLEEANGNISFQPNVIPVTEIYERVGKNKTTKKLNYTVGSGERFRFVWYDNTFDLELFFNATYNNETRLFSLRDFEDDFNVTVDYTVNRNSSVVQFGWVIDNVENVSDYVHNAWFKIEDTQPFDYDEIEIYTYETQPENVTALPYNETEYVFPDNLVLSFEDLRHKGFIIGHQNKTSTSIHGFSGKSSWNLDPITYSSDTITVTGTTTTLHEDLWNADKAGTFSLEDRNLIGGTDASAVSITNSLRPADYIELGGANNDLNITVENWSNNITDATIEVVGTDRSGNSVSENITVTGNGDYPLTEKYATITSTQVVEFNDDVTWDLLGEPWDALGTWTKYGQGTSDINPAGQLRNIPDNGVSVGRYKDCGTFPDTFTVEMNMTADDWGGNSIGFIAKTGTYRLQVDLLTAYVKYYTESSGWVSYTFSTDNDWYVWRFIYDAENRLTVCRNGIHVYTFEEEAYNDPWDDGYVAIYKWESVGGEMHQDYLNITSALVAFDYELVQGQWGVIWKTGEQSYKIDDTSIYIGNNTAAGASVTDCSDKSVNVVFETNQRWGYYVRRANLTFGRQDSGYATSAGVDINWNSSYGSSGSGVIAGTTASDSRLSLYSCTIRSTYNDDTRTYSTVIGYFSASIPNVVIYNCVFDKVYPASNNVDIYNLLILRGVYGLSDVDGTMNEISIYDCAYALAVVGASKTMRNVDIIATDSATGVRYTGGGNDHYLINVDWSGASDWRFYWHGAGVSTSIFRQYEFDLTVTDDAGTALENANVTITHYGQSETEDFNGLTDVNGEISTQTLTMGFYNQTGGDTIYSYNPFNLNIVLSGYETYNQNFTLSEKTEWIIALEDRVTTDPVARFEYSPERAYVDETVTFDATNSTDPDGGTISSYSWDFGDSASGSGVTASHSYSTAGKYYVELTVTDDESATDTTGLWVNITDYASPTARFTFTPSNPEQNEQVTFDASDSTDRDGAISTYSWDFGDDTTSTSSAPTKNYETEGTFTVTLTVTDSQGKTNSATHNIIVENPPSTQDGPAGPAPGTTPTLPETSNIALLLSWSPSAFIYYPFIDQNYAMNFTVTNNASTDQAITVVYWLNNSKNETVWWNTYSFFMEASSETQLTLTYPVEKDGNYTAYAQVIAPTPAGQVSEASFTATSGMYVLIMFFLIIVAVILVLGWLSIKKRKMKQNE